MELAIPGIALGLMYIMKGQSNNTSEQEESFANQNALPNTDIPNRNYPDEYPIRNEELDQTSALSTVNQFENGGSVYGQGIRATHQPRCPWTRTPMKKSLHGPLPPYLAQLDF